MKLLTTTDVAAQLGVSKRRVQAIINAGKLPATKIGRDWLIQPQDLKLIEKRKTGRPRKADLDPDLRSKNNLLR